MNAKSKKVVGEFLTSLCEQHCVDCSMKRTSLFFMRTSDFWQSLENEIVRKNLTYDEAYEIFCKVENHFMASLKTKWRTIMKLQGSVSSRR